VRRVNATPLWTSEEIAAATGGQVSVPFEVTGVTFDSREVQPGDLFVAMPGTVHDGHKFVEGAFAAGAAGAIISQPGANDENWGPHVLVEDTFAALQALGRAGRTRSRARIFGVTGSVGKTSTKEALFAALDRDHPGRVHRSVKSYNNHTGVPLSLARMPRDARFAVLEMGMNNEREISALTRQVRPHVALITAIAPAHIENLGSEEAIADAKSEIFEGLEPRGIAIIPNDTPHRDRLLKAARRNAERVITFGGGDADVHALHAVSAESGGSLISAALMERELTFTISQRGEHWVSNALAVLTAVEAVDGDVALAGLALADLGGLTGRGARHRVMVDGGEALLIDESYNANPASMAAALNVLGSAAVGPHGRRIAVLGDMLELGPTSPALHRGLNEAIKANRIDLVYCCGPLMRNLWDALSTGKRGGYADNSAGLEAQAVAAIRAGDAIMIKGSLGSKMKTIVSALEKRFPGKTAHDEAAV
jgi:UDP-N-acetylmuramoyl-tripeptide--D-alanyl-D-alanine ligase